MHACESEHIGDFSKNTASNMPKMQSYSRLLRLVANILVYANYNNPGQTSMLTVVLSEIKVSKMALYADGIPV